MAADTKVGVGYNIQLAVDAKHKRRAGRDQSGRGQGSSDASQPARAIRDVETIDVETIDVVADRGDFKSEDIEASEKAGLTPHVAKPRRGSSVRKPQGSVSSDQDVSICPAGETLSPNHEGRLRDVKKID